ncbi:MAG: isoprenylcysteine carboxylmethyltransferase family protein [Chloroflexi bacterium]|nr:isoprenylcysteine carboxylmethyltransferase family protein [Chloroflexota bacterium]
MKESFANQVKSFILPFTVLLIIPAGIVWATGFRIGWGLGWPWDAVVVLAGSVLIGNGLYYLSLTIWLFINIGRGTLAPWAPTKKLVIIGPYRHVRNPMISSVLSTLLGESVAFGSAGIFIWFLLFFSINHIYFVYSEEPGLEKRFGEEYIAYKKNVPRWIPRLRPWMAENK